MKIPTSDANDNDGISNEKKNHYKEIAFLAGITGMSTLFGFGFTVALAKKKDPSYFNKGLIGSKGIPESGGALAIRALGLGTLYAVLGVGCLTYGVCKMIGINSMEDFRRKAQSNMPVLPKKEQQGRSEFKSVKDLVNYLIEEDNRSKNTSDSTKIK